MRERSAEKSLTNAIAATGVVSIAAAISAAGRSLSFVIVIQVLHRIRKAKTFGSSGNGEAIDRLKGIFAHVASTPREVKRVVRSRISGRCCQGPRLRFLFKLSCEV